MIKLENLVTPSAEQMKAVIRGMRNPKNSWEKSDTRYNVDIEFDDRVDLHYDVWLGNNDTQLMTTLANAGTEHRKYMRMMPLIVDITAPLYWWKEFDTYKVGTVSNSTSTMHKIHAKEFTLDDFSFEHLNVTVYGHTHDAPKYLMEQRLIPLLNAIRETYLETKNKSDWWQLIQLLPSSYNQKRTICLNYEVLTNIYKQRRVHKLDEWREFCEWIETLPYAQELIIGKND